MILTDKEIEQIAEGTVCAGLVAWAGDGPCPCNIALLLDRPEPQAHVTTLLSHTSSCDPATGFRSPGARTGWLKAIADNRVIFTTEDARILRQAIAGAIREALKREGR